MKEGGKVEKGSGQIGENCKGKLIFFPFSDYFTPFYQYYKSKWISKGGEK